MRIGQSNAFKQLAVAAARDADRPVAGDDLDAQAESVSRDADARAARDALWAEYEAMLRDTRTWTVRRLAEWLGEHWGVSTTHSSVHRDRKRILRAQRVNELANAKLKAAMELVTDLGHDDLYADGIRWIQQMILQVLLNYTPQSLADMKPSQIVAMMDTFAKTGRAFAETQMVNARLAELQRKFDREVAAAQKRAAEGTGAALDAEAIAAIRRAVFGEAAA